MPPQRQESVQSRQQIYQRTSSYPAQTYSEQVQVRHQDLPPAEQLAYNRQVLQPIRSTVRGRVSFYAQRTKLWQELEQNKSRYRTPKQSRKLISCQSKVSALHDAYTALQIQLFNNRNIADSRKKIIMTLQHLQTRDFTYLEGECPSLFKRLLAQPERIVTPRIITNPTTISGNGVFQSKRPDFSQSTQNQTQYGQNINSRTQYGQNMNNRTQYGQNINSRTQYGQNINSRTQYGQNMNSPKVDPLALTAPTPNYEERYQYAQSLLKLGKEQEARRLFSDLLASVRPTGNRTLQIKILKKISEIEFALRNYLPARILYEELQQLNVPFDKQHLAALQSVESQREKVDTYAALLLSSMTSNPEQAGFTVVQQARAFVHSYPNSPLRSNVEKLETKADQEAEQWFQGLLQKFDRLVANQQSKDALALLKKVPLDILPLDKQDIVQKRKNSLSTFVPVQINFSPYPPTAPDATVIRKAPRDAQDQPNTARNTVDQESVQATQPELVAPDTVNQKPVKTTKPELTAPEIVNQKSVKARQPKLATPKKTSRSAKNRKKPSRRPKQTADTELQKKWGKAEEAFQAAAYDKAITLFSGLLNTSLDAQAHKKIKKASLAAGQKARRKAANFFQRANSATDSKVRKQHLLSSKTLLEDILQKYPLAGLDAKVKRNLNRVDKDLAALDHTPFE
ncbi:MAG: hypothetical protein D3903_05340 [Candidatus Electrothrix sp. GM3_4]|nr:hypothetical protein [Candidatus Electrothrix sp. GM3_4]